MLSRTSQKTLSKAQPVISQPQPCHYNNHNYSLSQNSLNRKIPPNNATSQAWASLSMKYEPQYGLTSTPPSSKMDNLLIIVQRESDTISEII